MSRPIPPSPDLQGTASLRMSTRRRFGFSNSARLNRALLDALAASKGGCETCREIERDIDPHPEGGEYVESPSFPGRTIQNLDAHFKSHWKKEYEIVELAGRGPGP